MDWAKGFEDKVRDSRETRRDIIARADRVAAAAGPGFEADLKGWVRPYAGGTVAAISFSARVRNSRENILLRALEAGRGG
jgi:hypothetical protein